MKGEHFSSLDISFNLLSEVDNCQEQVEPIRVMAVYIIFNFSVSLSVINYKRILDNTEKYCQGFILNSIYCILCVISKFFFFSYFKIRLHIRGLLYDKWFHKTFLNVCIDVLVFITTKALPFCYGFARSNTLSWAWNLV